jgi:hypothetical protein
MKFWGFFSFLVTIWLYFFWTEVRVQPVRPREVFSSEPGVRFCLGSGQTRGRGYVDIPSVRNYVEDLQVEAYVIPLSSSCAHLIRLWASFFHQTSKRYV